MRRSVAMRARRVPWVMLAVSAVLAVAAVALGLSDGAGLVVVFSGAVLGLVFGVTGALVASRSPRNAIGWIFCALALLFESSVLTDAYVAYDGRAGASLPGRVWFAWTSEWFLNTSTPALIALCFLLFPTGRLPSARWRTLAWAVVVVAAVHAAASALAPGALTDYPFENPTGIEAVPALRSVADVSLRILVAPLMLVCAASLFVRLRHSSGAERQQLKWFAYAAALLAFNLVAANVLGALFGENERAEIVSFLVFLTALSTIPVAMGIAILKHRLYDIDVLINRTLVYGALTLTLALVYVGGVVGLQYALRALTGGESQLAIVASTLAIAALFNPLRRRIQSFIDRRFYRKKYDAAKMLEAFSARLRDETDLDDLGGDLVSVVRETVQPAHASLWLRETASNEKLKADG